MAEHFVLDTGKIEEDFFEGCLLYGLQTSISATRLCWLLESKLGLCFERKVLDDIDLKRIYDIPKNTSNQGTLFDAVTEDYENVFFPIYRHSMPNSELGILLYENRQSGFSLLEQYKDQNYFLLLQDEDYTIGGFSLPELLAQIAEISHCRAITIATLKNRENLII